MPVTLRPLIALGFAATLALPLAAQAAEPEDAIQYRQSALQVLAWQLGPMGAMAQGEIDYDAEVFADKAANLAATAHLPWEGFMEGTLQGGGHGVTTDALAKIGDDWEGFHESRDTFVEEANTLAQMVEAGEEFSTLRRQVGAVANSCKSCHDNYRAE